MRQALLGIEFGPSMRNIRLRNARFRSSFDPLERQHLPINGARVDIERQRSGTHLSMRVAREVGEVHVAMIFS